VDELVVFLDLDKCSIYGQDGNDMTIACQWMQGGMDVVRWKCKAACCEHSCCDSMPFGFCACTPLLLALLLGCGVAWRPSLTLYTSFFSCAVCTGGCSIPSCGPSSSSSRCVWKRRQSSSTRCVPSSFDTSQRCAADWSISAGRTSGITMTTRSLCRQRLQKHHRSSRSTLASCPFTNRRNRISQCRSSGFSVFAPPCPRGPPLCSIPHSMSSVPSTRELWVAHLESSAATVAARHPPGYPHLTRDSSCAPSDSPGDQGRA
jgi:hypothetical protein